MAIFKLGAMFDAISGKVGGQSLCNYPTQQIIRNIVQTNKFATPKQSKKRAFTAYLTNSWRQLTTAQRQGWDATAINYTYVNRVGDTVTRNGYQTFCFCNQNLNLIGVATISSAPTYIPVTEPKINVTDITSGNFEIQSNNASSDYLYALFGLANISPGASAQLGQMKYIGEITAAQLTAGYDVVSDMEDIFGTLSFPNKMAITVDPINQTTGNRKQFVEIIENIDKPMIIELTVSDGISVTIPFATGSPYTGSIDWGDGTITTFTLWNSAGVTHTYTLGGTYRVLIFGIFQKFVVNNVTFKSYLTDIIQFGTNNYNAFNVRGCTLLTSISAVDTPRFQSSASLLDFIRGCTNLTAFNNINNWDVTKIVSISAAFNLHPNLIDISNWRLLACTNFSSAFSVSGNSSSLALWNVSAGTNFLSMFASSSLNPDVSAWDVSSATSLASFALSNPTFNGDVSNWDVSNVTNFSNAFKSATVFNRSLANWDIRAATNMTDMLKTCGMSVANWNATLIAWDALVNPPSGIVISAKPIATGAGLTAKNNLIATWGWTITEGV